MNPTLAVATVALTLACAGRTLAQQVEAAVVVGEGCPDAKGGSDHFFFGTGVIVGRDRVLTAMHVVTCEGGTTPSIAVYQGDDQGILPARIEVALPRLDVVRLIVPAAVYAVAPVSVDPRPHVGDNDLTIVTAWPLWQVKHCVVQPNQDMGSDPTGVTELSADEARILIGCDVEPGNSGGAAYDSHGRLVGLMTWTARSSQMAALIPLQSATWITKAP